jgi:hypothetical protein
MCTAAINVLAPRALNSESQYFIPLFSKISLLCRQHPGGDEASIPLFSKISLLCRQHPGGDEASNEGCNSGPREHDFTDNSNIVINTH